MDRVVNEKEDQPSMHWFAYVSPVCAIMALTLYLATDATSSLVYVVISIVTGIIGLLFSYKAGPHKIWPILSGLGGAAFAGYVGWLAITLAQLKAATPPV